MDNKYAIIKLGGTQLMVTEGQIVTLERQKELKPEVLVYSSGDDAVVGTPVLDNIEVKAEVLEEKKAKKIDVARFRSKSRYKKRKGHRQPVSVIKITSISEKKKAKAPATKEATPKKAETSSKVSSKE